MSRKIRKDQTHASSQKSITAAVVAVTLIAIVAATVLYQSEKSRPVPSGTEVHQEALASSHSPTLGDPDAKVHIVEFLDPACGTCALFFPMVKEWLNEAPDRLRLSVRHVAFHTGSDYPVKILEASRNQDKYWQTLEALLTTQRQWVLNHTVQQDRVLPAIVAARLDVDQLLADMNSVEVMRRIEQDKKDSIVMKVSATPEYFVNGRPLPSFGQQQLMDLVREELERAY